MHFNLMIIRNKQSMSINSDMEKYWEEYSLDEPFIAIKEEDITKEAKQTLYNLLKRAYNMGDYLLKRESESISSLKFQCDQDLLMAVIVNHPDTWKTEIKKYESICEIITKDFNFVETEGEYFHEILTRSHLWEKQDFRKFWMYTNGYDESACEFDENGNLLSDINPNGQWDWYIIGGRWENSLILKEDAREKYDGKEAVNTAKVKDIDWTKMFTMTEDDIKLCSMFWDEYIEGKPVLTRSSEYDKFFKLRSMNTRDYYIKGYGTKEGFIKSHSQWGTYAVMDTDGEWFDRYTTRTEEDEKKYKTMDPLGEEAMTFYITEEKRWKDQFYSKFIKNLKDDDEITIVDYHC